ncbi:kinetochore-associated protein 1-like [Mya arenaria]|uniref:kinetochore-associated protein 1-like n=1 Tax=Mya arenaria TaxID=6604 RepID=UPI0022DFB241|nr:kinetochore-associated protein 1-like [Mya arenaria]
MAEWDNIKTDFGGDETVNFGPRKESGSALYQIDTVATVSCQDLNNHSLPTVSSSLLGDLTCLAVDKTLLLNTASILSLDTPVEEVEWSPDGSVVVLGTSGGSVFMLDAESTDIIFSMNLVPPERLVNGKAFCRILFTGDNDLVVLTADGQLIVQPDISLNKQDDGSLGNVLTESVQMTSISPYQSRVHDIVAVNKNIYTLGGGESVLCHWNYRSGTLELVDETPSLLSNDVELKVGEITTDGHYIFAIDSNHHVSVWDLSMLVCVQQFTDMQVTDICLLETNTSQNNSLDGMKLVVLTKGDGGECSLKVQALPDWSTVYNLQLAAPSLLAKCSTFQDALYIAEFIGTEGKPETLSTLRYRRLSETDPKTRLYRILQKNKFEEAEQFANLFRLDIELVHKVKANYLIDQLSPWNADKHSQIEVATMIQQLWICLETIVDEVHMVESCMMASLPTFCDTEKLLNYCKTRLDKSASSKAPAERERVSEQYSKLLKIQRRLTTFKLAFGEKSFTGEVWRQFVEKNLLSEALRLLDQGQVDTAFIIWIRHQCQWTNQINRPLIQQLLSVLHDGVSSPDLLSYICDGLLPSVVREVPQALEDIVDFVIEKTKNLEVTHKDEWPKNAIQFADFSHRRLREASAVVLDDETCMATDNAHKTKVNMEEVLSPLAGLIVKLHQLDDVLHKYRCRLSLAQFLQETKETIAFRMLDKVVALELIAPTLERQIRPYMAEHNLNQDTIFSKYIRDLLERYGQVQSFGGETAWEAKSAAILDCITDVEQKINGILEVMQFAPIPWSSRVEQLVQASLKLKHCKVESIREQCLHVEVKKLMMKYGFKNTEVPEGPEAEHLMYMMLSQDKPGCLEDAQQVKSCDPDLSLRLHTFRLRQLIAADRLEEGLELLRNLAPALGVRVGSAIVNLATVKLDYTVDISHIQDQINSEKRLYTDAAIHVLKYLQSREKDPLMIADLKEQESVLKNMRALQVEFSEYLTVVEYSSEEHRLEIMYNYIKEFYIALKKSPKTVSYAKVYRLAHILNIPHISILGQMAIRSANLGNINTAVQICRDLYESSHSQEVACTLMEVVRAFLDLLAEVDLEADTPTTSKLRLLPDVCCRLANQAVSICDPDCLCEYLEVCRACSLLQDVGRQCEAGDDSLSAQWGEGGDVHIDRELWADLSLDVFQEDALIMSSSIALPLVAKYIQLNPLYNAQDPDEEKPADERSAVDQMCTGVVPVVQHLRGNSHIQLALAFSVHMLHTLLKYTLQQDMGLTYTSEEEKAENVACQKAYTDLNRTSQAMLKELVFTLLMKIFSGSRVDEHLAFMYLSTRPKREVMDCMLRLTKTASQSSHKKLKVVASLGQALGQILKEVNMISSCQDLEANATWGHRLSKMKISFRDAILGPNSEKTKLLPAIAQNPAADTKLVTEFCQAFKLDEDEGLLLYLDHLFVPGATSEPETEARNSNIARAYQAITRVKNQDQLVLRIKKIYYRTSAYDYETLKFCLEVMKTQPGPELEDIPVQKGLQLLEHLMIYTRVSSPSEYETEFKIGGDKKESQMFLASLPPESKTRLPLHPLLHGDPWKIITPELRKKTVNTWLLIAKLLTLSPDQICLTAVQNMVRVYTENFSSPDAGTDMSLWHWRPDQANSAFLQDLQQVLHSIKNCESSLACAKWMVNKLPLGSEKVLVLDQCIKLAELWHHSIPDESAKKEKAMQAYLKFRSHWQKMASAQALCLNSLGEAELLQATDRPSQLIQRLYEHPSITDTAWDCSTQRPDIHTAAERIAHINNIHLDAIQHSLIEKWLQAGIKAQQESDTTMTFSLENLKFAESMIEVKDSDEEINFRRIIHLVKRENRESNLLKLFDFALKPGDGRDTMCSIQALRCLLHLCDEATVKKECNKSLEDIRKLLYVMVYIAGLEKLHIRHTVDTFISCQKEGLIRGIWKNHSHEKSAVSLVSSLCLDYEIYDIHLWNSILQRLHSFGLMRQLEYVLVRLNNVPELWPLPALPKMWFTVVSTSLLKVCAPLSKEQIDTTVRYFNLLVSCPVVQEVDGTSLSRMYQKLELPACALGALLMTSDKEALQSFISQHGNQILSNVKSLCTENGFNHGLAVKIEESVYEEILAGERFEMVLNSPQQKLFVAYCIREKNIDTLLVFSVKHHMIGEAKQLVGVYIGAHTDVALKVGRHVDVDEEEEDQPLAMLKGYLSMQGLQEYLGMLE